MLLALALTSQLLSLSVPPAPQDARRGWLGVSLDVEEDRDRPLRVSEVGDGSPARRADLRPGDRIVALAGHELESYDELIDLLREFGPGAEVELTVRRALEVELDDRGWREQDAPRLGVHLGQADDGEGVRWVVRKAEDGWPAARAGVRDGDRLLAVAGREPADFDELQEILARVAPEHELRLVVERDLLVRLGERPGAEPEPGTGRFVPSERYELTTPDAALPRFVPRAASPDLEAHLREEIAGLRAELRALREELSNLRRELSQRR